MVRKIGIDLRWRYTEYESSYLSPLEYHEKSCHPDEEPISDDSANSTDDWDTTSREWGYLVRQNGLNTSGILFDNIKGVTYIFFSEYEENNFLNIRIEMKSGNSIFEVGFLSRINPMDNESCSVSHIVDHDGYECADDNTPKKKYSNVDSDDGYPRRDIIFFSTVDKGAHKDREKTWYHEHHHNGWEDIENK